MTSSLAICSHSSKGSQTSDQLLKPIEAMFMGIDAASAVEAREPFGQNLNIAEPGHKNRKRYSADDLSEREKMRSKLPKK